MDSHVDTPFVPPQAPSQAEWDAMTPDERRRVVEALPASVTEAELSPPEGDPHRLAREAAVDELSGYFRSQRAGVYVGTELTVYYPAERRFAPDLMVVFDVDPHTREKWVVSEEGKGLDFVLEVHYGGDRKKDAERNVALYARIGIPEYFIYDRRRQVLRGYRQAPEGRRYVPIVPQYGRFASEALGLDLAILGERLTFFSGTAELLGTAALLQKVQDVADQATRRHEEAEQRREEAERALAEEQRRREEEQRRREEAERALAESQARVAELERLLRDRPTE
jgi:Uma2 family endonuclease